MSILQSAVFFAALLILAFFAYRSVKWAKRSSKGAEFLGSLTGSVDSGTSFNPAQEVLREKRKSKCSEEGSGDPDKSPE